ncbi:MAG: hypothetical protein IKG09_00985, partial [Mycoplasmataceae bacterium]|nr:hypothetical protein [Mycoplasmataceae bacterium]
LERIHPLYNDRNIKPALIETSVGDFTFNDLLNKNIKNVKNNLFTKFEKIEGTYNNPYYNKKIKLFKDPNSNKDQTVSSYKMNLEVANESNKIWYNDQDYTLKNQKLKALINDEELNIQNFIVPKWNNNQIVFDFNDIFKEMILNIYNLSYLASKLHQEKNKLNKINNLQISYQEAFENQWNNSNQIWSTKWYTNAVNEFNIYLKEALAYNSNNEDYEWSYLLKWIKDFFSEDIYINYANENIKIWDSKSFSFISFNIKENQNTINKMYKNSNSNLNLINKLKIEDNSKFNISNGNLVILNNNNSAPTLKNISEANVTFKNNKNSFNIQVIQLSLQLNLKLVIIN